MIRWIADLLGLFFPETCVACDSVLQTGEVIVCTQCRHELPYTDFHLHHENAAFMTFYGRLPVSHVVCLLHYHRSGRVQRLIHKLKYKGREDIGALLGEWTAPLLKDHPLRDDVDVIVPVPMHRRKLRQRGYNQVAAFGRTLSKRLGIPYEENVLVKTMHTKSQSKKSFLERMMADDKGFTAVPDERHHGRHFLIVDDVLTTGATLERCGKALLEIPGAKVSIVTMAMTFK